MSFRVAPDGIIEGSETRWATVNDLVVGVVPEPPRNPAGLLLVASPSDYETPVEQLQVELHVRPRGYLCETLLSATRLTDHHCPRGQAHLIAER